ncbi:MAG: YncE family protein [Salibacteraceae bacterium]
MKILYLFFGLLFVLSCSKSDDFGPQGEPLQSGPVQKVYQGALILNEGNFGFGNASLSVLDLQSNEVQNNVYQRVNNRKLGDVAQSSLVSDSLAFLVINNSNKVIVVSLNDFSVVKEISIPGAPRYVVKHNDRLLVSTMGAGSIYEISLLTLEAKPKINFNAWLDEMLVVENLLYACNRKHDKLEIFDLNSNTHIQSIKVGKDPESVSMSSRGDILVLCTGGYNVNDRENAAIYLINNSEAQRVYTFQNIEDSPSRLKYNSYNNSWCFLNHGLFSFKEDFQVSEILKQTKGNIFYGLGVNPIDGNVFVTNVKNYVENGEVICINNLANLQYKRTLSIIPQHIVFY